MIDLRSDTVTKPSEGMREAMRIASVGDELFGEDPTTHLLEETMSALFGKDAALFVSSGTMGNQLAIATQTRPGDEVIVGEGAHVGWYESGASAALSGVQFESIGTGGLFTVADVENAIKPIAFYCPRTSLVCVENTHNRGGGKIWNQAVIESLAFVAHDHGLKFHLDGARIWNAHVATGISLERLVAPFDTVSVCFSKGLGAPVGSMLLGSVKTIEEARRFRKMWGGAMRQTGMLAAAAIYAMDRHLADLKIDHEHASELARTLATMEGVLVHRCETNIVLFDVPAPAVNVVAGLEARGIRTTAFGPNRVRLVTHRDLSSDEIERACEVFADSQSLFLGRT